MNNSKQNEVSNSNGSATAAAVASGVAGDDTKRLEGILSGQAAPAAETPAAETPAAETPAAETPAAETPAAETPANGIGAGAGAGETPADGIEVKPTLFTVGWPYGIFLSKNGYSPSLVRSEQWKDLSRVASKAQVTRIAELAAAGAATKCTKKAVWSKKDSRFNTVLTARVVQPGCNDQELILDTLIKAQKRASETLADMRAGAARVGCLPVWD